MTETKKLASDEMTLQEVASRMDITRERVRQIESAALAKLKKRLLAKGMAPTVLYGELDE